MATQQIVSPVVQQQKSAVVFSIAEQSPQQITQTELVLFLSLRVRLQQLDEQVAAAQEDFKARFAAGALVQPGDHRAELKENFRRNVSWKDVTVRLAQRLKMDGEAYCAKVLSSTKPSRTVSLVVE
jgi:alkanesulfonate monooxygenase SsuD/methylene tetrahydromethanopterin reductase-like flavin-dependent oxidoreductase (luciferase family)